MKRERKMKEKNGKESERRRVEQDINSRKRGNVLYVRRKAANILFS